MLDELIEVAPEYQQHARNCLHYPKYPRGLSPMAEVD
jgi:hypothetical protein